MKSLSTVLEAAIKSRALNESMHAQGVFRQWREIVGPALAERSWPDRFEGGIAFVAVEGSAWAQELRLNKDHILALMTEMSKDKGLFQDVRFGVRPLPSHETRMFDPAVFDLVRAKLRAKNRADGHAKSDRA